MRAAPGLVMAAVLWAAACKPPEPVRATSYSGDIVVMLAPENGLRVVVVPDPKANHVQVTMRYAVGTMDDPAGREGMAHLVEHLMFLVPAAGGEAVADRLAATATWWNAVTRSESTAFISWTEPGRLAELLDLESVRLTGACGALSEVQFLREREVVQNELRQRERGLRVSAALMASLYPAGHPYGRAAASEASVGAITYREACAFMAAHYAPDSAVLVVSGDTTRDAVDAAIRAGIGRVPRRAIAARPRVSPMARRSPSSAAVPLDRPIGVVAWPLPDDPAARARLRLIAALVAQYAELRAGGSVYMTGLGDAVLGLVAEPERGAPLDDLIGKIEDAGWGMELLFGSGRFERARARALYRLYAQLEHPLERDELLAGHVAAGRHPRDALREEAEALEQVTEAEAWQRARHELSGGRATIVRLLPADVDAPPDLDRTDANSAPAGPPAAGAAVLTAPLHPLEESRGRPGARVAAAEAPAEPIAVPDLLAGARERTLSSGLRVILLPLSSVPTVDVRLVLRAGLLDEPEDARGLAILAAHALQAPAAARALSLAGGVIDVSVDADHTVLGARGLDMNIDRVLGGLAGLMRDGEYAEFSEGQPGALERARAATDARARREPEAGLWRAALYGAAHPYARLADPDRAWFDLHRVEDLRQFRARHFNPGEATLIVAGGFDPAIAEPWVVHHFEGWRGPPRSKLPEQVLRRLPPLPPSLRVRAAGNPRIEPLALGKHRPGAQVAVDLALPIEAEPAAAILAAQIVDAAVADVRDRLGASYGVDAWLEEVQGSRRIRVGGLVAAERAAEALALIRDRLGELAAGDAAAARFVAARRTIVARLSAIPTGASSLADLAEADVERGRPLGGRRALAEAVRAQTLARLAPTLAALDLGRAAILLRGPRDAITAAFAALGRTPRFVE